MTSRKGEKCPTCGEYAVIHSAPYPCTPEPEAGSPAWTEQRRRLWDQNARNVLGDLVKYEDEHPDDAVCLSAVLDAARRTVPRA